MTKEEFLLQLQDLLQTDTKLKPEMVLEELEEWDSLSKLSMLAFLDTQCGVKATFNEFQAIKTVDDLAKKAGVK